MSDDSPRPIDCRARFYDPTIGRFIQPDTVVPGGVQGYDRYAYVGNSPINYADPSGHMPTDGCQTEGCNLTQRQADEDAQKLAIIQKNQNERTCQAGNEAYCSTAYHHPFEVAGFVTSALIAAPTVEYFALEGGAADAVSSILSLGPKAYTACLQSNTCASILAKVTGITVYRVWGGGSEPDGHFWTPINPFSLADWTEKAALPLENSGEYLSVGTVNSMKDIAIGEATKIAPNSGGLLQYLISNPEVEVALTNVYYLIPPMK